MLKQKNPTTRLIYNPNAGKKRHLVTFGEKNVSLQHIQYLLNQYQIPVVFTPTKGPGDATNIAKQSIKEGFTKIIVAGGDGTIGETANGLINSDITLGILPLGSFMNIARMLSIPSDIEKAIMTIKIGNTRKIDVGSVTKLDGEKLSNPYYFLESAGLGLEAQMQHSFLRIEQGNLKSSLKSMSKIIQADSKSVKLVMDDTTLDTKATLISIANGPLTGANLYLAPKAKLNDHMLTITIYSMDRFQLLKYFLRLKTFGKTDLRRVRTYQTKKIRIEGKNVMIHADARVFGHLPASFEIIPNALNVITGFPLGDEEKVTYSPQYQFLLP